MVLTIAKTAPAVPLRTWSESELQAIAQKLKEMVDAGDTRDALQALGFLLSKSYKAASVYNTDVKNTFIAREDGEAGTLIEGLRQTGLLDEQFLQFAEMRIKSAA
jgi:hypothetical protein